MTDKTAHEVTDEDRRRARDWAWQVEAAPDAWTERLRNAARVILADIPAPTPPTTANENPGMTDQTLDDQLRPILDEWERIKEHADWEDMDNLVQELRALLPARPTLADMTLDEQAACQWMQCDVKGDAPAMILRVGGLYVHLVDKAGIPFKANHGDVTPRPDLPRLEWPGDKKPDTSAPESTLAVGSVWSDINALTEACEESGRDQIIVSGYDGYAFIWDGMAEWWEGSTPPRAAPFTILHTGHETDW